MGIYRPPTDMQEWIDREADEFQRELQAKRAERIREFTPPTDEQVKEELERRRMEAEGTTE